MNDFLNPKSMLTPGAAGALMMLIANTLCSTFPELGFRYVALGMSFLIGAFAIASVTDLSRLSRGGFWVMNSLVIFCVGVGTSNIARNVEIAKKENQSAWLETLDKVASHVVPNALAQGAVTVAPAKAASSAHASTSTKVNGSVKPMAVNDLEELMRQNAELRAQLRKLASDKEKAEIKAASNDLKQKQVRDEAFFKRW